MTWLHDLLAARLFPNGIEHLPRRAAYDLRGIAITDDPANGRTVWTVANTGAFALQGDITPSQITSNQNNYNPTGLADASVLRLSTNANREISGIAGGADGRVLILDNIGSNPISLPHDSGSSTAANRFSFPQSLQVTLGAGESMPIKWDATLSRWRLYAGIATPFGSLGGLTSSPAQITSDQNDYSIFGASWIRVTTDATRSITGFTGGTDRRFLIISNVGSNPLLLRAENTGSSAANRLSFLGARHLILPGASSILVYDPTSARWRLIGDTVDANQIDDGNSGTAVTVDWTQGPFHKITLTGNATVTFTAPPRHRHVQLDWVQDATGGRTITFSPVPKWQGGVAPTWVTTANARNSVTLFYNGTDYVGSGLTGLA